MASQKNTPYCYFINRATSKYDLFIIVPVDSGKNIKLLNTTFEDDGGVMDIDYQITSSSSAPQNIARDHIANFDFDGADEIKINVRSESNANVIENTITFLFNDIGDTAIPTIVDDLAINCPYIYMYSNEISLPSEKFVYPKVVIPLNGFTMKAADETINPGGETATKTTINIDLTAQSGYKDFLYPPLTNAYKYKGLEAKEEWYSIVLNEPQAVGGDKKRRGRIKNRNADGKPGIFASAPFGSEQSDTIA